MRLRIWRMAVLLVSSLVLRLDAGVVVVGFDDLVGQGWMPVTYADIQWGPGWEYYDWPQDPYNAHSVPVRVGNNSAVEPYFVFMEPGQVFLGAWIAGTTQASVHFDLYSGGNLVGTSQTLGALSATPVFLDSGYDGPVDRVVFARGFLCCAVLDDLTYQSVPEPETALLMAFGLGGMAWKRARMRLAASE